MSRNTRLEVLTESLGPVHRCTILTIMYKVAFLNRVLKQPAPNRICKYMRLLDSKEFIIFFGNRSQVLVKVTAIELDINLETQGR